MEKFFETVADDTGAVIVNATVAVINEDTGTTADIFTDKDGTIPTTIPGQVTTNGRGYFE